MKLSITKASLVAILTRCAAVAKPKSPMPALSCVRLEASSSGLSAQATDLYQEVTTRAEATVAKPGAIAVGCRELLDRAKTMPNGPVTLEIVKEKLVLSSGKRKHTLPTMGADDFPPIAAAPTDGLTAPAAAIAAILNATKFAMCDQADRANIHGVLFERLDGTLRASATDGNRMSRASASVEAAKAAGPILLSYEAVGALAGLLAGDGEVVLSTTAERVFFTLPELTFACKLVAASFPSIDSVLRIESTRKILAQKRLLLDSLASVEKGSGEGALRGLLTLNFDTDTLRVSAEGRGAAEDDVDVVYPGKAFKVGALYRYLSDAIGACESDEVELGVGGELDPIFVRPVGSSNVVGLVMPARTL